ncbi:MAG: hypothetical protein QXU73_06895 [Thermoplasmata archaeon]
MERIAVSMDSKLPNVVGVRRVLMPVSRWICALLKDSLECLKATGGTT